MKRAINTVNPAYR